jgi:DNA invertase Pin-like site-specific DNA recombinase
VNSEADMTDAKPTKAITYLRVSTERQGRSGLGLEAQREAIARYLNDTGLEIAKEYLEVETGKGANALSKRPQLQAALAEAKRTKSRLVLAKLDRLARNVHFVSGLMESGADFVIADMPHADRFRLHLEAVLAEEEAARISARTKAALAAAKERGQVLGKNGAVLAQRNKALAAERLGPLADQLRNMRGEGLSMRTMVAALNAGGVASPAGGKWHLANLHRAMGRLNQKA